MMSAIEKTPLQSEAPASDLALTASAPRSWRAPAAIGEPQEIVAAEAGADTGVLPDDELNAVTGGYLQLKLKKVMVTSYSCDH